MNFETLTKQVKQRTIEARDFAAIVVDGDHRIACANKISMGKVITEFIRAIYTLAGRSQTMQPAAVFELTAAANAAFARMSGVSNPEIAATLEKMGQFAEQMKDEPIGTVQ